MTENRRRRRYFHTGCGGRYLRFTMKADCSALRAPAIAAVFVFRAIALPTHTGLPVQCPCGCARKHAIPMAAVRGFHNKKRKIPSYLPSSRGSRNRTHIDGFGDRCSTFELCPYLVFSNQPNAIIPKTHESVNWF